MAKRLKVTTIAKLYNVFHKAYLHRRKHRWRLLYLTQTPGQISQKFIGPIVATSPLILADHINNIMNGDKSYACSTLFCYRYFATAVRIYFHDAYLGLLSLGKANHVHAGPIPVVADYL